MANVLRKLMSTFSSEPVQRLNLQPMYRRTFKGASKTHRTRDWMSSPQGINSLLWNAGLTLRTRGRYLVKNDPYAQKYVKMMRNNVAGPKGILLQAKVKNQRGKGLNTKLNEQIEKQWELAGQPQYWSSNKRQSRTAQLQFLVSQLPADGEFFVQRVYDRSNPFGFSTRIIDPDQLDHSYNVMQLPNGNMVLMGVEVDKDFAPQAYWFWDKNPYDNYSAIRQRKRVPASEIIHYYFPWFTNQVRGFPHMVAAMWRMNMLDGYEEAEVTAARVGAAKMAFLVPEDDASAEDYDGPIDDPSLTRQEVASEASPGAFEILPKGFKVEKFDPNHPNTAYAAFVKAALRGIASGWGVSYNTLANDLEGVNFSSIRSGLLEERDEWKLMQNHLIDHFMKPLFAWWLEAAWLSGKIDLGNNALEDVCQAMTWSPRRWAWVDPYKDVQSAVLSRQNGLETLSAQLAEKGEDFEETIDQLAYEQQYIAAKGVKIGTDAKGDAMAPEDDADEGEPSTEKASGQQKKE